MALVVTMKILSKIGSSKAPFPTPPIFTYLHVYFRSSIFRMTILIALSLSSWKETAIPDKRSGSIMTMGVELQTISLSLFE